MTDDERRRLDLQLGYAIGALNEGDEMLARFHLSRAREQLAAFDRRKSGEGGEDARDAARYRWLRDESANSVLGPFVMSAGPGMYGWIEGERTDALVDAARTEGKGNG